MSISTPKATEVAHVLMLCPHVDKETVERDLQITGNVERTINRILDGQALSQSEESDHEEPLPLAFDILSPSNKPTLCDAGGNNHQGKSPSINYEQQAKEKYVVLSSMSCKEGVIIPCVSELNNRPNCRNSLKKQNDTRPKYSFKKVTSQAISNNVLVTKINGLKSDCFSADSDPDHTITTDVDSDQDCTIVDEDIELKSDPILVTEEDEKCIDSKENTVIKLDDSSNDSIRTCSEKSIDVLPDLDCTTVETKNYVNNAKHLKVTRPVTVSVDTSDEEYENITLSKALKRKRSVGIEISDTNLNSMQDTKRFAENLKKSSFVKDPYSKLINTALEKTIQSLVAKSPLSLSCCSDSQQLKSSQTDGEYSQTSSSCSTGSKKQKRTQEEIEERKKQALHKKAEREKLKAQKDAEKARNMQERDEKRKQKLRENNMKQAQLEQLRNIRPGECLKFMVVVFDSNLQDNPISQSIKSSLEPLNVQYYFKEQPVTNCVTWKRKVVEHSLRDDLNLATLTNEIVENQVLIIIPVAEFVTMVHNYNQEIQGQSKCNTLRQFTESVLVHFEEKQLTILVTEIGKYFRDQKTLQQRAHRQAVLGQGEGNCKAKKQKKLTTIDIAVSRIEMEEALVDLQLRCNVPVRLLETADEVAAVVQNMTKAIAEKPFKQDRNKSAFSFHIEGGGVKVDKEGKGLLQVWKRQIQQFKNISPEIASAIITEYPSPGLLLKAYSKCITEKEKEKLLANIAVRRGTGVLETSRRVGKEMSRRIYQLMNSSDPTVVIK